MERAKPPGERRFVIGRAPDCDILLDDVSVGRWHAELIGTAGGRWLLIDRHSQNGTSVEDAGRFRRISQEVVRLEDRVKVGDVTHRVDELLRLARVDLSVEKGGQGKPAEPPPLPEPWARGRNLVRCACGGVKAPDQPCPGCGR